MFPFIEIFGKVIGTYQIMALFGILAAGTYCAKTAAKQGLDDNDVIIILLISAAGAFFGAHILYALTNLSFITDVLKNSDPAISAYSKLKMLAGAAGGNVFYGGLIGGILTGFIYCKIKKMDISVYGDIVAPGIPLFHFFGRIGCFLGGCCFGIKSSFGVHLHSPLAAANGVSRFPVQLLEAAFNLILFFVLHYFYKKGFFKGKLLLLYLAIYAVGRFFIEFLRGDELRGIFCGISTSQIISILILIFCAAVFILTQKKK